MANLLAQDPVYISLADYRDTTTNTYLKDTATDDELKSIIYKSQRAIDDYIVVFWCPCVEWQDFIFPTLQDDDTCIVPTDIAIATVFIWDSIYTNQDNEWVWKIKIDKSWPETVEYFEPWLGGSGLYIGIDAKYILDRYKLSHCNLDI